MPAGRLGADLVRTRINPAMRRIAFELDSLTYDQMMIFAQGIGEALGVLEHSPTGMSEDELTTEAIASAIAGWIDGNREHEDRNS